MKFPAHVEEAKRLLENNKDYQRLKVLRTLTESEDLACRSDLEGMWGSLFNAEKKYNDAPNCEWVVMFLDIVMLSMKDRPYYSMDKATRNKKLQQIEDCSKKLKIIYAELGINEALLMYDPEYFYLWDEDGMPIRDTDLLPVFGIDEALDFYHKIACEEVGQYVSDGKIVARSNSNRFIKILGRRNNRRYKQPLLRAIIQATYAIYGEEYEESDAHSLIVGRKKKAV